MFLCVCLFHPPSVSFASPSLIELIQLSVCHIGGSSAAEKQMDLLSGAVDQAPPIHELVYSILDVSTFCLDVVGLALYIQWWICVFAVHSVIDEFYDFFFSHPSLILIYHPMQESPNPLGVLGFNDFTEAVQQYVDKAVVASIADEFDKQVQKLRDSLESDLEIKTKSELEEAIKSRSEKLRAQERSSRQKENNAQVILAEEKKKAAHEPGAKKSSVRKRRTMNESEDDSDDGDDGLEMKQAKSKKASSSSRSKRKASSSSRGRKKKAVSSDDDEVDDDDDNWEASSEEDVPKKRKSSRSKSTKKAKVAERPASRSSARARSSRSSRASAKVNLVDSESSDGYD